MIEFVGTQQMARINIPSCGAEAGRDLWKSSVQQCGKKKIKKIKKLFVFCLATLSCILVCAHYL